MRLPEEMTWWLAGRGSALEPDGTAIRNALEPLETAPRVAIVAHHDPNSGLSHSTVRLVEGLTASGYVCALVSTSPHAPTGGPIPASTVVVTRPNLGYDFGSWATALRYLPTARANAEVLLTNDSMVGPFTPLNGLLSAAGSSGAAVWAVTSSLQLAPHLQSYFLRFSPGVLAHPALVEFFDGVRHLTNKVAIVRRYELGLTRVIREAGLTSAAGFPAATLGAGGANPTMVAWRALMEAGYPFFKRTLLRDPRVRVETAVLRAAVRDIFGADLDAFLEEGQ